jgi:hypothetical protein
MAGVASKEVRYSVGFDDAFKARKTSVLWSHFGFLFTDEVLTDDKHYYCRRCTEENQLLRPR